MVSPKLMREFTPACRTMTPLEEFTMRTLELKSSSHILPWVIVANRLILIVCLKI